MHWRRALPPPARSFLEDSRNLVFLLLVILSGFALGCVLYLAMVRASPFAWLGAGRPSGAVGWVTIHAYPKRLELVYYAAGVLLTTTVPAACVGVWLWGSAAVASVSGIDIRRILRLSALGFLPGVAGLVDALVRWPSRGPSVGRTLLGIGGVMAGLAALYWLWSRLEASRAGDASAGPGATAGLHDGRLVFPGASVLVAGAVFAWFAPLAVPHPLTRSAANNWPVWSAAFGLAWLLASARLSLRWGRPLGEVASAAALPFLPAFLLLGLPFLASPQGRLGVLVGAAVVGAATLALWRGGHGVARPADGRRTCGLSLLAGMAALAAVAASDPGFPGMTVPALDGDHLLAWLNEGRHGRLPYRDFWYPYGPLRYYFELGWVALCGLDRYTVPAATAAAAVTIVILAVTSRRVFLSWPFMLLGSAYLFFAYGSGTFALRGYLGYLAVVWTAASAGFPAGSSLRVSGALSALSWLYSHEVAVAALAANLAMLVASALAFGRAAWPAELRRHLARFVTGFLVVLAPLLLVALFSGMLPGYVRSTLGYVSVVDDCCGAPFPNLLKELPASPSPADLARLLLGSTFTRFYLAPLTYVTTALYLLSVVLRGRGFAPQDRQLFALLMFGGLLYRVALSRSEASHATFVALPALVLLFALLERLALRMWRDSIDLAPGAGAAASLAGHGALALEIVLLSGIGLFYATSLDLPHRLIRPLDEVLGKWRRYHEIVLRGPARRPTPGLVAVRGKDGGTYLFSPGVAPTVQATLDFLHAHTAPGEGVYAFPYTFRYNVLLNRPNPLRFGPAVWAAAALPADRARLVEELGSVRPRYVVYDETEWPDADGVPWGDRFPEVADFIFSHYALHQEIGGTFILGYVGAPAGVPPSTLDVALALSRFFLLRGWYHPEDLAARMARWTTLTAPARLWRRHEHEEFELNFLAPRAPDDQLRTLWVSLDGREIGRMRIPERDGWSTVRWSVPAGVAVATPVTVAFVVDRPYPAQDARRLGIVIKSFGFR